jgi:Ribulose 1,5-bisphosphate carboxylase, large subunit
MYFELPFDNTVSVSGGDYVVATYYAFGITNAAALKKAGQFATGQSVGTWLPLPGVTRDMVENWQARVLAVYPLPSEENVSVLRIAFPHHNFASSFAMMLTAMVGNDVSTALRIKLVDLELTPQALAHYAGPKQGIAGFRSVTGVYGRPLVLNMIKPCLGFPPERGAELFYQSGLGGVDLIKDDEVLGNTKISGVAGRLKAYLSAAGRLKEETGKAPVYIVNITDTPKRMRAHAKAAVGEGAKAVMVNFVSTGVDAFRELTEEFGGSLCFLAHYAGAGVMNSPQLGIAGGVMLGVLPRLAGADSVMTMFAGTADTRELFECLQTVQKQKLPMGDIRPVMTSLGGGITPLSIAGTVKLFGNDVILGVGGAIQGHPMGTTAGAKAVMASLQGAMEGKEIQEVAAASPELKAAVDLWQ